MSISSTYELYKEIFRPEVGNFNPTRTLYTVCFQWIGDAVYKAELDEKITLMINQDGYQVIESTPDNSRMEIRTKLMNLNRENTRDKHYVLLLDLQQPHAVTADSLKNLLGAVWSERSVQDRMTVITQIEIGSGDKRRKMIVYEDGVRAVLPQGTTVFYLPEGIDPSTVKIQYLSSMIGKN